MSPCDHIALIYLNHMVIIDVNAEHMKLCAHLSVSLLANETYLVELALEISVVVVYKKTDDMNFVLFVKGG